MIGNVEELTQALAARPLSLAGDVGIVGAIEALTTTGSVAKCVVHPAKKVRMRRPQVRHDQVAYFRHHRMHLPNYRIRATFVAAIPNCTILGERFVILDQSGHPIAESIPTWKNRRDGQWATRQGRPVDRYLAHPLKRIEGSVSIIANGNWRNYWHWHVQCLSNIGLLRETGLYDRSKLLVPPLNEWRADSLRLLDVDPSKLITVDIDSMVSAERLYYPSYLDKTEQYNVNPAVADTFAAIARRLAETTAPSEPPRLIYVARFDSDRRSMANEQALADHLGRIGFATIVPGELNYADQVRAFSRARWIVGAHGAGLTNILFAPADCGLIELFPSSKFSIEASAFRAMTQMTGRPYYGYVQLGDDRAGKAWKVNLAEFVEFVREALSSEGAAGDAALRHFKLMKTVDVAPLLAEIQTNHERFYADTSRQKIPEQRETMTIHLRSGIKPYPPGVEGRDFHESRQTKMYQHFPVITRFLEDFAAEIGGELGRATIVSLQPFGQVYRHFDRGEYYRPRDRYHLVLKSKLGSILTADDERVRMKAGELWWFNNNMQHEAFNESDEPRIHVIFDVLPRHLIGKVKTIIPEDQPAPGTAAAPR